LIIKYHFVNYYIFFLFNLNIIKYIRYIGDWGLGIGDWGLGPIPNPQSPSRKIIKTNIIPIIIFNYIT